MKISDLLPQQQIVVPLRATAKDAVIDELLTVLPIRDPGIRAAARAAVFAREAELTTGIGGGVAIPHGQCAEVASHLCAFGVAPAPLEFDSIDGRPCRIFFLCVSNPKDVRVHVRVLSQMCRVLNSDPARRALAAAASPDAVRQVFLDDEQRSDI